MIMNKLELMADQQDCADMLGMTLEEYQKSLNKIKVSKKIKDIKYDNSFLESFGIKENMLKKKKHCL